jgi:hypothetical protein
MLRPYQLPGNSCLPEPKLLFAAGHTDTHPLRGLIDHGPYSLDLGYPTAVRLAYLLPTDGAQDLRRLTDQLNGRVKVREAPNYYLDYPGFQAVFRSQLIPAPQILTCTTIFECDRCAASGDGEGLAQAITE